MGFWRFLGNEQVNLGWLCERSRAPLGEDFQARHVLSIQDSSTIGFQVASGSKTGLTTTGTRGDRPGFVVHPNLMLDAADGRCLGISEVSVFDQWTSAHENPQVVRRMDVREKKTWRWLETGLGARKSLEKAGMVTHVADREADFFEMLVEFGHRRRANEHLLVRVNEDRRLGRMEGRGKAKHGFKPDEQVQTGPQGAEEQTISFPYHLTLEQLVAKLPVQARWTLHLPDTPKRKRRAAPVCLRFARNVPLRRPKGACGRLYQGEKLPFFLYVNVIDLVETPPPGADYRPIRWRLYTTHPVQNMEQARQIVQWYCWRWKIELLFATVKSKGLDLERALVEKGEKLKKLAILVLMAAVQVIQLLQARDGESQQTILEGFSQQEVELLQRINPKLEGRSQKQKNPHPPDSLAFATWVIARLGGWKGYKTHRPPGIKTISRGLLAFFQIKNAAAILENNSV